MTKITKIIVTRAEGLIEECITTVHTTIEEADMRLMQISLTAPKNGGYDKTDVCIMFDNGDTWKSRHDIKFGNIDEDIANHWRSNFNYILTLDPSKQMCRDIMKDNPKAKIEARAGLNKINAATTKER
uniref:Uncharacterized protein n=1 Tax=viral metagenome TaxID=1070528 RepID=A0A6M3LXR4_9ZZZZ